jgi:hypothetical protein
MKASLPPIRTLTSPGGCRCYFSGKEASALGAIAADTRTTATPLTKPSQPPRLVTLLSSEGLWEEKSGDFSGSGLEIGWETQGDHWNLKPSLGSLKSRLA